MNKKRFLILFIICIFILIIIALSFLAIKYNKVNILEKGIFTDTNQNVSDGMEFFVYDNTEEKLKTLVRIARENGIDTVEYVNENNENIILDCHGKQRVSIDVSAELNKEYSFLVTSAGNTVTEKFLIDEAYMKEYLEGIMSIADISVEEGSTTKLTVQFHNIAEGKANYYKIGKGNWIKCTNLEVNEININSDTFDLNGVEAETGLIEVYTKQEDVAGNTLIKEQDIKVNTVKLDVFNDMRVKGKSLQQYGFTASWSSVEEKAFSIGNFQAGHHTDNANWSGTFTWNNPKTYGAKQIYVDFYHCPRKRNGMVSNASSRIIVNYIDGTQEIKNNVLTVGISETAPNSHCPITMDLKPDAKIKSIQFYLYGHDNYHSSSYSRLTNIVLKGIPLPIIE